MRIYCFNREFISCSTNGNDPAPNKILLTRSFYGRDDVRPNWRPPSQSIMFLISIQCLTLRMRIYHSQSGPFFIFSQKIRNSSILSIPSVDRPLELSFSYKKGRFLQFPKSWRVLKVLNIFQLSFKNLKIQNFDLMVSKLSHSRDCLPEMAY